MLGCAEDMASPAPTVCYQLFESRENGEEGPYMSYGIRAVCGEETLASIEDISTDPQALAGLVDRMNSGNLSPVHFRDVIEDFLTL